MRHYNVKVVFACLSKRCKAVLKRNGVFDTYDADGKKMEETNE